MEARRELDDDPDRLVLLIMELRTYRAAYHDFHRVLDTGGNIVRDLPQWKGSSVMALFERNTVDLVKTRAAKAEEDRRGR